MKKNMVRVLAFVLVLILALGLIPLGALAATLTVHEEAYHSYHPTVGDWVGNYEHLGSSSIEGPAVIKTSQYDELITLHGFVYELQGFVDFAHLSASGADDPLKFYSTCIYDGKGDATVYLGYAIHQHSLSRWYSDSTTHWRECLVCKRNASKGYWEQFLYQNWHSDGDEDRICDVCGADIPYHEVEVIDSKGAYLS